MYSALNCGRDLGFLPSVENIFHDRRQAHESRGAFLSQCFGPLITREIAPGADVKLVERIGAALALLFDFFVAGDLSHVAAPLVALAAEIAERRMFRSADACHVGNALREHADERAAGGVALPIDRKFLFGKMAPASFDHPFFKSRRPGGHAIPEIAIRLGTRKGAGAVAIALGRIFDDIVLVRCDQLALFPDRRAHGAVGVDRIVGPISARIGKIKSARERCRPSL